MGCLAAEKYRHKFPKARWQKQIRETTGRSIQKLPKEKKGGKRIYELKNRVDSVAETEKTLLRVLETRSISTASLKIICETFCPQSSRPHVCILRIVIILSSFHTPIFMFYCNILSRFLHSFFRFRSIC